MPVSLAVSVGAGGCSRVGPCVCRNSTGLCVCESCVLPLLGSVDVVEQKAAWVLGCLLILNLIQYEAAQLRPRLMRGTICGVPTGDGYSKLSNVKLTD